MAFAMAQCAVCHRMGKARRLHRPNELTGVAGRFNRHDPARSILDPPA